MHSFDPSTGDGGEPSGLILGSDGNFYGTTIAGGTNDAGTVFKMTPDGTESVLYSFHGYPSDSAYAASGLFQASDGNFYGTTDFGGPENKGTVFKVSPSGIETVLYSFGSVANDPAGGLFSPLVESDEGNLYGVSAFGGTSNDGEMQMPFLVRSRNDGKTYELRVKHGLLSKPVYFTFDVQEDANARASVPWQRLMEAKFRLG